MATNPDPFFSTLPQAIAATVGFSLTFATVFYSLERKRREKRTDNLRNELTGLKEQYENVVESIILTYANGRLTDESLANISKDPKRIREQAREQDEPAQLETWAHFKRINSCLDNICADNTYLLSKTEFEAFNDSIEILKYSYENRGDHSKELYRELQPGSTDSVPNGYYQEDIFNIEHGDWEDERVKTWLQRREGPARAGSDLTGTNLYSHGKVIDALRSDFSDVDSKKSGTIVNWNPILGKIIISCGILSITGIFLPVSFLTSSGGIDVLPVIGGNGIFVVQSLMIIVNLAISLYILALVYQRYKKDSSFNSGSTNQLFGLKTKYSDFKGWLQEYELCDESSENESPR